MTLEQKYVATQEMKETLIEKERKKLEYHQEMVEKCKNRIEELQSS